MKLSQHPSWFVLLFTMAIMACSTAPPRELIERNDHSGLAAWYEQEAVRLRGKAEDMRQMAELYAKSSYQPSPKESKTQLIAHCRLFIDYYTKSAEEAEALAKLHQAQEPAIP